MPDGIIIIGLNGCGKTTVGRRLAEMLHYRRMDVEDYYFPASEVPYSVSRTREEVRQLMLSDIKTYRNYVLSSVNCNWGSDIVSTFRLAVLLSAPLGVRMERIQQRTADRFGSRALQGGDMYESEKRFQSMAASRSPDEIKEQAKLLPCPVLEVDATLPAAEIAALIYRSYRKLSSEQVPNSSV